MVACQVSVVCNSAYVSLIPVYIWGFQRDAPQTWLKTSLAGERTHMSSTASPSLPALSPTTFKTSQRCRPTHMLVDSVVVSGRAATFCRAALRDEAAPSETVKDADAETSERM